MRVVKFVKNQLRIDGIGKDIPIDEFNQLTQREVWVIGGHSYSPLYYRYLAYGGVIWRAGNLSPASKNPHSILNAHKIPLVSFFGTEMRVLVDPEVLTLQFSSINDEERWWKNLPLSEIDPR